MTMLRLLVALLALVMSTVACEKNPTRPTPVLPTHNVVSIADLSPRSARVDKGSSLGLFVRYELNRMVELSAIPRLDASGTATQARATVPQRVGPGIGEVWLIGASVLVSSSVDRTEFVEVTLKDRGQDIESFLIPVSVRWYAPVTVSGAQ